MNARPASAASDATRRLTAAALAACLLLPVVAFDRRPAAISKPASAPRPIHVEGRAFRTPDGARFSWRGLTAFRLLELVAHGPVTDATALLDWATSHGVTVVRVLAMADVLFQLSPDEGRTALPRLLELAAARGLYVEIVALADTNRHPENARAQVRAVGTACGRASNCVLEIANEPWTTKTQREVLGDPRYLLDLRSLVPSSVPVSIGSGPRDDADDWALGDYVTVHIAREEGEGGWEHVLRMRVAEALSRRTGKPVVDDEPIGAAQSRQPGRRDDDPAHWLAMGLLARILALGATFHYEAGLQARVPDGREAACFEAWRRGLDAAPANLEDRTVLREVGSPGAAVVSFDRASARAVVFRQGATEAWAVIVAASADPQLRWGKGWRQVREENFAGGEVRLIRATHP